MTFIEVSQGTVAGDKKVKVNAALITYLAPLSNGAHKTHIQFEQGHAIGCVETVEEVEDLVRKSKPFWAGW